MSVIYLLLSALCFLVLAYRYYLAFIAAKVLMLDDRNMVPAVTCNDGTDYIPTNKWIVFGHHFAAIAGAGPLIGPTLAAQYGWGPGFFWILLGSVSTVRLLRRITRQMMCRLLEQWNGCLSFFHVCHAQTMSFHFSLRNRWDRFGLGAIYKFDDHCNSSAQKKSNIKV